MPTPPTDLHSLAARAHALHVLYSRTFADDDIAGAEATMEEISDLTEWLDASDHLVRLRRAARSVRRMKYFHLSEIQHGWLAARRAVARLAPS